MEVAVLGAPSARGRRVVRDLLERPEVSRVVFVGDNERQLIRLAAGFGEDLVRVAKAAPTVDGIAEGLTGCDVAVATLQPESSPERGHIGAELAAFEAALAARVPYVTACEDPAAIDVLLSPRFTAERRSRPATAGPATSPIGTSTVTADEPVVAGMSWTPGLSNILVRAAADRFEAVRTVRVAWSTSRNDKGADGLGRLIAGWAGDATVIKDGARKNRPPGSKSEQVFFPEPVGWQRVHTVRGAEVASLPKLLGGLESLVVQGGMGGASASTVAQMVARAPAAAASAPPVVALGRPEEGHTPSSARRRLGILTRAPALGLGPFARRPSGWSALRIDVTGRAAGTEKTETYGVVDHLANLEAGPIVAAALLMGREVSTGRGVLAPEAAFAPGPFLAQLAEFGIRVAHLER
ncbi:MAG TPA: hypothetical protein VHA57_04765 [Actinomycetota bacterium]|nr:hypothetical protein [Actinomycetota bacterium]